MENRSEIRKILDFEEFPLYADFFYKDLNYFHGHIQNISPSGLCIILMNSKNLPPPDSKGILHLIHMGRNRSVPATVKWVDNPKYFIKYVGIEVNSNLLEPIIKEFFPDMLY